MHFNFLLIPTLVGAALLFRLGFKVSLTTRSTSKQIAWSLLAGILAIPATLFVAYYGHVLDKAAWFYSFRAAPYTELTASGLGFGAGLIVGALHRATAAIHPARQKLFAFTCMLLCAGLLFLPYVKPLIAPIRTPQHDKWSEGVCLQSTPSTCGPCSAATLLRQFHISASERDLSWECFSYSGGTENWYVARALRRYGLETQYLITSPQPADLPIPAIAGVQVGGPGRGGHFITTMGREGERYIIGDPLVGKLVLTPRQLYSRYYFTGFFLLTNSPSPKTPSKFGLFH